MGMKTIMDAKEVMILAKGMNKATAIAHTIEGAVSGLCPHRFCKCILKLRLFVMNMPFMS